MKRPDGAAFGFAFDRSRGNQASTSGRDRPDSRHRNNSNATPPSNSLPVHAFKKEILYLVETHATLVLLGETGSGKTTQVPQFLLEAGWAAEGHQIACTQPRRAAAASVAARVAEEQGTQLGDVVGYSVRFDSCETKGTTKVKFLTDGVLIREMLDDPLLTRYSVVMVDEAHERSLATDMLLGLLKKVGLLLWEQRETETSFEPPPPNEQVQRRRPELRLIISSATLQAELLCAFFTPGQHGRPARSATGGRPASFDPAVLSVEGRTHPVEVKGVDL